jgi:DsbC/DsbD-like thiol-disulfide interchange protein
MLEGRVVRSRRQIFAMIAAMFTMSTEGDVRAQAGTDGWVELPNARVRLVDAGQAKGGRHDALLEMRLATGWKTYWRMPGDAGIPPSFDWSTSQNAREIVVRYPAPISMPDQGGVAVGYKDAVAFPIEVVADEATKPARLVVDLAFGVCKDICIPVEAKLAADLAGGRVDGRIVAAHAEALARVPVQLAVADAAKSVPALIAATGTLEGTAPKLVFRTRQAADVFIEAPDNLFVPLARKIAGQETGEATFEVDLTKSPEARDLRGKPLRLTIVPAPALTGVRAIETIWTPN